MQSEAFIAKLLKVLIGWINGEIEWLIIRSYTASIGLHPIKKIYQAGLSPRALFV